MIPRLLGNRSQVISDTLGNAESQSVEKEYIKQTIRLSDHMPHLIPPISFVFLNLSDLLFEMVVAQNCCSGALCTFLIFLLIKIFNIKSYIVGVNSSGN